MKTPPTVSVCLLTYNRASVLRRSIESLLEQDLTDFELIINDDCSPDETKKICEEYAAKDHRVSYYRNETNLRYAGNQNAAMKRAKGEFIAYVHDGDVYYSNMLTDWVAALSEHPTAGIVFNAVNVRKEHGTAAATHIHDYPALVRGSDLFSEMITSNRSPIFGIVMLRATVLRTLGQFDTALPVLADVDMWLRLLLRFDAAYVATPLYEIMPREVGHVNRAPIVNWSIQSERDQIYFVNLARRHGGWHRVPSSERRRLSRKRTLEHGRALAVCLARGNFSKFVEGARALSKGWPLGATVDLRQRIGEVGMTNRIAH